MRIDDKVNDIVRSKLKERMGVDLHDGNAMQQSSIDRFFRAKGTKLFGYIHQQWQLAGIINSIVHSIAAITFIILSVFIKGFPVVLPLIFGIAAAISLTATFWNHHRNKKGTSSEVRLSTSGRRLLQRIGDHIGWHDHDNPDNVRGNLWGRWWQQLVGVKTVSQVMTPAGSELLEAGCSEYNRVFGLMTLAKDSRGRSTTLLPQINAASDEAMISLINQVALLEEAPENQSLLGSQCRSQISKLHELANRYEEMLSGPITLEDRLSSTTVIDNVLDHMRMEAQAHEELRIMNSQD
jgi:hypothetical protein